MQIVVEILHRLHAWQDRLLDILVVADDVRVGEGVKIVACLQVDKFAEREAVQHIAAAQACDFRLVGIGFLHRRRGVDDAQQGIFVVAFAQLFAPVVQLECLVYQKHNTAGSHKFAGKVDNATRLEVEIVGVDVQALSSARVKEFLSKLQQNRSTTHTSWPTYSDHSVAPIDIVDQCTTHGGIEVFHEISVCSEEGFQHSGMCFIE